VLEEPARVADHITTLELDRFEMGIDAFAAGWLQGAEQSIAAQAMIRLRFGHCVCRFGTVALAFARENPPTDGGEREVPAI
jgi:hypothetical protein